MSGLNIQALRAKLNELSNRTKVSDILWKPTEGDNQIRIVPLASNPENPFQEVYFHYLGGKTYLSPLTFGEPDPIEEFGQQLRAGGGLTKEEWNETRKFFPILRTFAPIVVRGKESEGVRYWGFGKTVYKEILGIINDEEVGDIVDPKNGRDLKITFTPGEKSDTKFPKTSVRVGMKQTAITDDKNLLEKILTIQPNIFDFYERLSYDDLKEVLTKYITPSAEVTRTTVSSDDWGAPEEPSADSPSATKEKSEETTKKTSSKKSAIEDFEKLFES